MMRALAAMLVVCAAASCGRRNPAAKDAGGDAAIPSQPEAENIGFTELSLKCWSLADGRVRCRGGTNTWAVEPGQGPVMDKTLRLGRAVALTSGGLSHLCALLATGEVKCWGNGERAMPA
jgi:hypothetical protein